MNISYPDKRRYMDSVRVQHDTDCWFWMGSYSASGEPIFCVNGKVLPAHRVSYMAWVGEIPGKLIVVRTCILPICCNWDHLKAVARACRTHCKRGHEFTEENTRVTSLGGRQCRTCERDRQTSRRQLALSFRSIV